MLTLARNRTSGPTAGGSGGLLALSSPHTQLAVMHTGMPFSGSASCTKKVYKQVVTVTEDSQRRPVQKRKPLVLDCAIDTSGSMLGEPLRKGMHSLTELVRAVAVPSDLVGLTTFASKVNRVHYPMKVKKLDFAKDQEAVFKAESGMVGHLMFNLSFHDVTHFVMLHHMFDVVV